MKKNTAGQKIGAQLVSATDGSAFTGSVTVYVTGDAGTQAVGLVSSGACTHEGNGYHTYAPAQAETNYDLIAFTFTGTGAVPVTVQLETLHDANVTQFGGTAGTFSSGRPEVNTTHISGDATAADNAEAFFDGTGYAGTNNVIPTVTNLTNLPAITANWLTAAGTAADFGTEIGAAVLSALGTGTWASAIPWNASWDAEVQSEVQDALEVNHLDHLLATAADGTECANSTYWARLVSKSATPAFSSFTNTTDSLEAIRDRGDVAWVTATGFSTLDAAGVRSAVGLASANLDTQLGNIVADTNEVQTDLANGGRLDLILDAILADTDSLDSTKITTARAAVLADWIDAGRLDLLIDAIKAKTDNLPAAPAATGDCITAAGVRTAVGLTSANLDTQLDTLPTAAENAAALLDLSNGIETGLTPRQAMRLFAAALGGVLSGGGTTTITIKGAGVATTRVTATVDADGNRSALTLNL